MDTLRLTSPRLASRAAVAAAAFAALSVSACAKAVTVDSNGSGATATATGGASSTGGNAGASTTTTQSGPCTAAEDCAHLSDACNTGACINAECGVLPANDGSACEDGKQCTLNDYCQGGACKPGTLKSCTTNDPCMVGICDVLTDQCSEMPGNNGSFCSLNDSCILQAQCINGVCQPSQIKDCSFLNTICGDGYCDQNLGCQAIPKNDGSGCNDGLFCTVEDQCISGQCKGKPNVCVPPNDPCKMGVCNEPQKQCVVTVGNNGAVCDDGNLCTTGETCNNGSCLGGVAANNGLMCDDQNGCTGGTTCDSGVCGSPTSEIMQCVDGDMCCPAGCMDKDCLWYVPGVQQNIPPSQLTGWTQCYQDLYGNFNTPMSQIVSQCDKAKLLMACRPVGAANFTTLAMGPRVDVLHECGSVSNCVFESNGVGWYYSDSWSWGYAPGGEVVTRNSCDTFNSGSPDRLCWHSGGGNINGGYRCGSTNGLNGDNTWERIVFEAD